MSNILGENHLPYVQEQIKVRQKILGKTEKSSQDIVWANGKTSWVRLISSVDIDGQEVPRYNKETNEDYIEFYFGGALFREQYLELSSENYSGNRLASELTLDGGTPIDNKHRFGIAETNSTLPGIQNSQGEGSAAYGLGGTEFGIKPMPGITGFNSKTYDNGSLRMAEITIIAHNKKQFEYLESLYLRVGYTMLLEWGNSSYPKSIENDIATYSSTSDIAALSLKDEFLEGSNKGVDYFYTQIENNRKISKGNYDGFLGKVTNFSWDFDKNGSYNITLKLITVGSVIESLKLNTNLENFRLLDNDNPDIVRPSALSNYLSVVDFYEFRGGTAESVQDQTSVQVSSAIPSTQEQEFILEQIALGNITDNFSELSPEEQQSFLDSLPENVEEETTEEETTTTPKPNTFFNDSTYKGFFTKDDQKALGGYGSDSRNIGCRVAFGLNSRTTKTYVRLGEFLNFINKNLLIYDLNNNPIISIDIAENLYCYSNGYQFPSDPSKVIIRFEASLNAQNQKNDINLLPKLPKFHDNVNGVKVGKIMNLYFSTDYIREQVSLNEEDGKLKLLPFLKTLIESCNFLLGGINKLKVRIKDKTTEDGEESKISQVIEIYDEVQPFEKDKLLLNKNENPILNVYGFTQNLTEGNFVTDYSFNTTIDKDFTTQISIGAQAAGRAVGEDSTIFSKWNEGLVDRVLPKKLDIDQVKEEGTNARVEFKNLTSKYISFLKLLKSTSIQDQDTPSWQGKTILNEVYTLENVYIQSPSTDNPTENTSLFAGSFGNLQTSFFKKSLSWLALTKNAATPFIGFLPVNLSLTFDGLSGIRIFDKLRINSDFLPSNYTNTLEFIITQLDHKFENNKWFTTIGTLSIPKLFSDTNPSVAFNLGELIEESFDRKLEDSIDTPSYFYSDQPIITGSQTGGKVTIDQILKALNQSPEVQTKFKGFLEGMIKKLERGFEIRINSSFRDFRDSNRVYFRDIPIAENRVTAALRSPHTYGLALDIELFEPGSNIGSSPNLIAGKSKKYVEIWQELGITDLANNSGLRWGGVFKRIDRITKKVVPYYDCVHFDAAPTSWPTVASTIENEINTTYPNIKLIMTYGYQNSFRDFGLGESIYDVSLKDYITLRGNLVTFNKPTLRFENNLDRTKRIGSSARESVYKSILIEGNTKYFDNGKEVDLFNLLTNSVG